MGKFPTPVPTAKHILTFVATVEEAREMFDRMWTLRDELWNIDPTYWAFGYVYDPEDTMPFVVYISTPTAEEDVPNTANTESYWHSLHGVLTAALNIDNDVVMCGMCRHAHACCQHPIDCGYFSIPRED